METQNILEQVKKAEVKLVSLQFTDLVGVVKEVIIPVEELEDALTNGVWFDGSSIEGFARIQESDLFLKPDPTTYSVVPWLTENGKTARLICDIYGADGESFEGDPRLVLKRTIAEATEMGFRYYVGPEPEFYLFRKDDAAKKTPIDSGGYFEISSSEGYGIIREIIAALKAFRINAEASHHEVGQGQYEIDFNYGHCLEVADEVLTLKYTVKKIAEIHNLEATFMPKPIMGVAGSGMHIHQSLFDIKTKENAFHDEDNQYKLSKIAHNFIAGQMKYIIAMCAILCPTVNSYKRLISGFEAPVYITWASRNRSSLIRVPLWFRQKREAARIELRCPDPTCNPYLAFAVMLKTGLAGIKTNLMPPKPVEENVYQLDNERLVDKNIDVLPTSLWEALNELKKNKLIKEVLGNHLFERYVSIKTEEWEEFKAQVTSWEINKYLGVY
ncbi:MAG: type I glutamate--ammonia ligase [Dehalococcoidales bacterium]|jgi:glutamine synthetase|nr:type I glutamate--ammonia ligase [Dehalococcoidales bacterium]